MVIRSRGYPTGRSRRRLIRTLSLVFGIPWTALSGCATAPMPLARSGSNTAVLEPNQSSKPSNGDETPPNTAAEAPSFDPADGISPVIPPTNREFAIDLTTALRLAEVENPVIAEARQRIGEALAVQQGAKALLFPSLNIGTNYHNHTGNLQRSAGTILNLNAKSLYFGGGADTVAANSVGVPAVSIQEPLTDAIFEPLAARQQVARARFAACATANQVLLQVAELHFELLAAEAILRVRRESAQQATEVARLTWAYAVAQQGRDADAQRGATELSLIQNEVHQAEEQLAVASARLAHRLHLDQTVRLQPVAPAVEKVTLVDPATPQQALIDSALRRRPEMGAHAAAVAAAETHHKQELRRPLLPTLWLGFSGGAFGGGSNQLPPELARFGGRTDFDVAAFWTLQNLGLGNLALQKQRRAQVGEAASERLRTIASIRTEVSAALAEATAAGRQIEVTTRQVASAEAGFREDLERIRNTVGRPIEVVDSFRLLNRARVRRIRAVTDYNKAEFRLFVALGSPPPLGEPVTAPIPPAPIAAPVLPPLADGTSRHVRGSF